jgi:arylsulfatase A
MTLRNLILLFPAIATAGLAAVPATKPNIVFILADDLGVGSVNCYHADPKLVRTPNIDRLAREGRRFTDANTPASVCSPTRYATLTGRYCWRTPLKHEVLGVGDPLWIETSRLTVASLLKRQGYRTAAIGKWHLGYGPAKPVDFTAALRPGPQEVGFDYHFGVPSNHGDVSGIFVDNEMVFGLRSRKVTPFGKSYYGGRPFMGIDAPQREDERVMDVLTDKAVAWVEQQDRRAPFFLYFTPVAVHEPSTPSAKTKGSSICGPYGDWIHELDNSVGRLLDTLDRRGLAENTLIIFTSDNGGVLINTGGDRPEAKAYEAGMRVSGPWRGRKHSIYEGGFRVPYLARWPGRIPAGTVCNETISLVDTLATTAALVGEILPPAATGAEDSYNVLPALLGEKPGGPLRPDLIVHSADGVFAIRQGPWKWIEGRSSKPKPPAVRAVEFKAQLYNLADDPAETHDVSAEHPEVVRQLSARLNAHRDRGHSRTDAEP